MKAKPKANTKTPVADKSSEKENKILREELDRASAFVQEIKSGNLAATYTSLLAKHPLGESLLLLRNQMAALLTQEQQRNWLNEGLARFAEILRKRQQESLPMLMNEVLSQLVRYVGATQGILSVLLEEDGKSFLQSVSHYAAEKKIKDVRKFDLGEGLTGEVMITRKEIYLEKIPRGYLTISSGLGKSAPVSVLVMPLLLDTEPMGVVELAFLKQLQPHEIEFVKKIGEAIASAYFNMRINERTRMLLSESQEKELQLKEQEVELRKNMDQLFASREEILKIQLETEAQTKIINSLAIVSRADIKGDITYVNDEFVKWSKYTREEVMGKNHRFLKSGDQEDTIFIDLWKTISSGRVWRGEIKNKAKDGSFYWVDAIIAPVLGADGKPKEYIAQRFVINDKKAREAEVNTLLVESHSIRDKMQMLMNETEAQTKIINSLAIVSRADIRGDITYVNDEFVKWSKYTREEVMGRNHRLLKSGDQDDSIFVDLWKTISSGKIWRGEVKNKAKDGSFYWVDAIIAPVLGADGKPKEYIAQRFVINDKKAREAEVNALLIESQTKEEKLRVNMQEMQLIQDKMQMLMNETEAQTKIINSLAIVSRADIRGDITYVNDEFVKWSKYTREEVMGRNHRLLKSGDQDDSIFVDLWKTISSGKIWRGEVKNKAKDGSFYWVDAIIAPVLGADGKPKEYIAQRFVINDKKARETEVNALLIESQTKEEVLRKNMLALEETQLRLSQLMKETEAQTNIINSIAIVSKADVRGDITYVNDEFLKWSKYTREEVMGKNHRLLKSGDQNEEIFTDLWRTISKGKIWRGEIKNKAKDGSHYWVDAIIAPVLDEKGKPKEYIAQRFVINDKKVREDEMNSQNQLITQAHEKLNQSFQELQVAQEQIVQTEKMAFLGRLTSGVAHEINTPLGAIKASSENVQVAMEGILDKTQAILDVIPNDQVMLFFDLVRHANNYKSTLTSAQRRAAKREALANLQDLQSEHPEAVAEFVVLLGINQDLPMWNPILVLPKAHEILTLVYDVISIKEQNQNIGVAVGKAAKILFALKKYSHQGHEEIATEFDVADNLETVMAIYSNNLKQVEVTKDFEAAPKIKGYPDELNQVWTNLIHNSLQAMDGKGKMEFKIRSHISGGAVVEVTDYGKGIAPENLVRVFDPFFTTKAPGEGTGLGLSIVKKIIDKHNGTIECESALGRGTTFRIVLPLN